MKDISYHILDIVQNSLNAGADRIVTEISENTGIGVLQLKIEDNGKGMPASVLKQVTDPFYTSSVTKKVGMGLPLLKQNAEITGGLFRIESVMNRNTVVIAEFNSSHIDMIPMGDIAMTFRTLIAANPDKDFVYRHIMNNRMFEMDTAEIRNELEDISMNTREVLDYICTMIREDQKALSV